MQLLYDVYIMWYMSVRTKIEYIHNIVDEDFYTVTQVRHSDKGQLC